MAKRSQDMMEECVWRDDRNFISFINFLFFSLSVSAMLLVLTQMCFVVHGTKRINRITMRPWKVCLVTMLFVAIKAVMTEVYIVWDLWFFIEGLCKYLNVLLTATLVHEKDILVWFMAYQKHFTLSQLDVHKDLFRKKEEKMSRVFWQRAIGITIIFAVCEILIITVPQDSEHAWQISRIMINLAMLSFQAIYLWLYFFRTTQFINLMKNNHAYEYERHKRREMTTLFFVTLALLFLVITIFALYCSDILNYVCSQFLDEAHMTEQQLKDYPGFALCQIMVPSLACYYSLTPFYCAAYAFPVLAFALTARPHDCFFCLSLNPDLRISNYQLTKLEFQKRKSPYGSERSSGGAFSGIMLNFRNPSRIDEERKFNLWRETVSGSLDSREFLRNQSQHQHRSQSATGSLLSFQNPASGELQSTLRPTSAQFCDQEYSYDYMRHLAGTQQENTRESLMSPGNESINYRDSHQFFD